MSKNNKKNHKKSSKKYDCLNSCHKIQTFLLFICILAIFVKLAAGIYRKETIIFFNNLQGFKYLSWISYLFFNIENKYEASMAVLFIVVAIAQHVLDSKNNLLNKRQIRKNELFIDVTNIIINAELYPLTIYSTIRIIMMIANKISRSKNKK